MAVLDVQNLTVDFQLDTGGTLRAVDGTSFTIDAGQVLGLVGESGSGKSVTALAIMRLLDSQADITAGRILFDGDDLAEKTEAEMRGIRGRRISMIFQEPMTSLNPAYTVGDQVSEVFRAHLHMGFGESKQAAIEMFERVKIPRAKDTYGKFPHEFSGGMRQRVMIAIALACGPDLLIADEPTTALDVTIQAQVLSVIQDLQRDMRLALLFISHDLEVVAQLCDKVAVMYGARIMEVSESTDLFSSPRHPYTDGLLRSIPRRGQPLTPIAGTIFDLRTPPDGCRFHPRCPYAEDRCRREIPVLRALESTGADTDADAGDRRQAACHFPLAGAPATSNSERPLGAAQPAVAETAAAVPPARAERRWPTLEAFRERAREQDLRLKAEGIRHALIGGLFLVGGLAATVITYAVAAPEATYYVAWGAVVFGGAELIRGLTRRTS